MGNRSSDSFGAHLKRLRESAGFTQEELATIAALSVHAISALERGERRRPHLDTVRALCAALDLTGTARDALLASARATTHRAAADELSAVTLPLSPTVLVGRDPDVQALRRWLAEPATRLVTLVGPGGVGKTRLALETARTIATEDASRVLFVSLATTRDPSFVASAIAETLGLSDLAARDLPNRVRAACADRPTLMVLDNFEHVLDAAPVVADLLTAVETLRLVVTSRAPLHLRGEREYAVRPLALDLPPETISPADVARAPAVRLFLERVRDVQPDFRLTPANVGTVTAICQHLDSLPLALELAAPWIKTLAPEGLLRQLEHDGLPSSAGPRDLPQRQQTMNATVAWSYQLLEADQQRAFRRLGALPGAFPIDAAAAVLAGRDGAASADDALYAVAGLIGKSLLLRSETSSPGARPLYYMLETIRAYAVVELTASGEREDALDGLVRYASGEALLAAEGLVGPAQVGWLDRVRENLEGYRAALMWLIERGRSVEAADLAWRLMFFWLIRGHAAEGLRWYEQILDLPSLPPAAESRALVGAAAMWYSQANIPPARTAIARALQLGRNSGDTEIIVNAELVSGHVEYAAGNVEGAREWFARSAEGFRALGIPWGVANSLSAMVGVELASGDTARAERLLADTALALQQTGPWFRSLAIYMRAVLALRRASPDEAIALVREGLTYIRELQDKFAFVNTLVPLAAAAALRGDDAWAARILAIRDSVTERTGAAVVDKSAQDLSDEAERGVRARLGREQWDRAYAAGRGVSIDALLQDIDRILADAEA